MNNTFKKVTAVAMGIATAIGTTFAAFAEGTDAVQTALSSGATSVSTSLTNTLTTVLPIALGVIGAVLAAKFGIRIIKSFMAGR